MREHKEYDVYNEEFLQASMDDDGISDAEEAFMRGYLNA